VCSFQSDTWEIGAEKCSTGKFLNVLFNLQSIFAFYMYLGDCLMRLVRGILLIYCLLVVVVLGRARISFCRAVASGATGIPLP
jgi:hypothetical protein